MAGLVLGLAPGEKFIVNGALLENGEKHGRIKVLENSARVLRCADALRPEDIDTPVKRLYYAVQLLITGDLEPDQTNEAIIDECAKLAHAFAPLGTNLFDDIPDMLNAGRFYSVLCQIRKILVLEAPLLSMQQLDSDHLKVA